MTSFRRLSIAGLLPVALAVVASVAVAEPTPSPIASVTPAAQDTTFKPEGSYELNVAVEGQGLVMTFVATKQPDGSYAGVFRHTELGEFGTTSFKVEQRTLTITLETPGGPAKVVMTVAKDGTVSGEWGSAGDGSKISGKKTS
jgi:hypothetical protein